jgi:Fe-S-cluster containining protein
MALAVATEEGDSVSCRAGCAACCRQLVPISVVEAHDLARAVAALPSDRREAIRARFAETVTTMERLGFLDPNAHPGRTRILSPTTDLRQGWSDVVARYFAAQIPCPVLEDERCSLYEDRPIVCREVLVVSRPEECTTLGLARTIARPIQGSEALATAAREFLGEPLPMLPLPLALEWSQAEGGVLELESDGGNLFNHLVAAVDQVEVPE